MLYPVKCHRWNSFRIFFLLLRKARTTFYHHVLYEIRRATKETTRNVWLMNYRGLISGLKSSSRLPRLVYYSFCTSFTCMSLKQTFFSAGNQVQGCVVTRVAKAINQTTNFRFTEEKRVELCSPFSSQTLDKSWSVVTFFSPSRILPSHFFVICQLSCDARDAFVDDIKVL